MSADQVKVLELEQLVSKLAHQFSDLTSGESLLTKGRRLNTSGILQNTDEGDTAFIIICGALVLMMTIPGLGLYYSGMVAVKNVLSTVMQSFSITCLM